MSRNFNVHLFLKVKSKMKKEAVNFIDFNINGCDFLNAADGDHLLKKVIKDVRKKTNLPSQCPFKEVRLLNSLLKY